MDKDIEIYNHPQFGVIRVVTLPDGDKGFVAKDVAVALGYKDAKRAIYDHVDEVDKTTVLIQHPGSNYKSQAVIINESGLYSLILSSKLPQAQEFKHWVTSVVLPQIARTGGYIPVSAEDDEKMILCKAVGIMKRTIEEKDALIAEQAPMVEFAERVHACENSIYVGEMAKILHQNGVDIGRNRLFIWLRENKYIFQRTVEPRQEWVEKGIFEVEVEVVNAGYKVVERVTPKITPKGQRYFLEIFLSKK